MSLVARFQGAVVDLLGHVAVQDGADSEAVVPGGREVGYVDLRGETLFGFSSALIISARCLQQIFVKPFSKVSLR